VADATTYPVEGLVPPDPAWPERFAQLAGALRAQLGPAWRIEHIGSTSVPGLLSKPVIDLALRIPDEELLSDHGDCFRRAGWSEAIALASHQVSFLLDGTVRRAIAHVFTSDQWPSAHQRLFASWLRRHPHDRDAYARRKQGLHDKGVWGPEYTAAKTVFVRHVVNRARAAQGLAPIDLGDQTDSGPRWTTAPHHSARASAARRTQAG
jgi:GrpB-like predicted nucleotidyltransferase (UPF0157 family)